MIFQVQKMMVLGAKMQISLETYWIFLNLGVWNGAGISQDNSLIGTVQESQHRDLGGSLF